MVHTTSGVECASPSMDHQSEVPSQRRIISVVNFNAEAWRTQSNFVKWMDMIYRRDETPFLAVMDGCVISRENYIYLYIHTDVRRSLARWSHHSYNEPFYAIETANCCENGNQSTSHAEYCTKIHKMHTFNCQINQLMYELMPSPQLTSNMRECENVRRTCARASTLSHTHTHRMSHVEMVCKKWIPFTFYFLLFAVRLSRFN